MTPDDKANLVAAGIGFTILGVLMVAVFAFYAGLIGVAAYALKWVLS